MEFEALLEARRSVRAFDETKAVTEDQIKTLIEAGIQAFAADCLPEFNAQSSHGAALVVTTFVSNRSGFDREGNPDNECGNGWGYYDLGLHNENFVLKAKELGLDTLIMGIRDGEAIRKQLSIPDTETVVSVIAVGYGKTTPEKPKRKSPEDIVKFF